MAKISATVDVRNQEAYRLHDSDVAAAKAAGITTGTFTKWRNEKSLPDKTPQAPPSGEVLKWRERLAELRAEGEQGGTHAT